MNAKNTNNTSSKFSLPSEFKEKWNGLVAELILDAFPDFLDKFYLLVPLIQELFIVIREQVEGREKGAIEDVIGVLNLKGEVDQAQVYDLVFNKLRQVFQEYSGRVFDPKRSLRSAGVKKAQH